jgi:hypothetical protein
MTMNRRFKLHTYDEVYLYNPTKPIQVDRIQNETCTHYGSLWDLARDHAEVLTQLGYDASDIFYATDHIESLDYEIDYDTGERSIRNVYVVLPLLTDLTQMERLLDTYDRMVRRNLQRLRGD